MPPRTQVPWDATVAEHLAAAAGVLGDTPTWIGRVIDERYRIVELLGEGGMGSVFVAEHLKLRKQVALKTIRPEFASNAQAEARFAREALATAQLDHPHVASAIDFGHLPEGGAYLVTQLVRGVSLAGHLDTHGKIAWGTAADLGAQIADALAAAHAAGIIHRDLKPDNILIETRDDGRLLAKVVDFGIARLAAEEPTAAHSSANQPLTRMGAILGTPGYMPPEQAVGDSVDARGDLYSLGVILWECCTGRRLWQGESVAELVACQLGQRPTTLQQELGSGVPEVLSELVAQLLAAAPSKRPDAAGPVRDVLRRLSLTQTVPRDPSVPLPHFAGPHDVLSPVANSPHDRLRAHWQTLRDQPRLALAIAGGLALLLLTCALLRGDGDSGNNHGPITTPASYAAGTPGPPPSASPRPPTPAPGPTPEPSTPPDAPPAPSPPVPTEAPAAGMPVPPALTAALTTLLDSNDRRARKRAADTVVAHQPKESAPVWLLNLAWLEKASSCPNKRGVLEKMAEVGDARVLPALRRLASTKRRGCGFFNSQDCLECLRETLARTIGRLQAAAPAPPAP